jgi:hypothetical protein
VAEMTAEQKITLERMIAAARATYEVLLEVKPPAALAMAIRDGKPFVDLGDDEVEGLCRFNHLLQRKAEAAIAAAKEMNGNGAAESNPVKPDAVIPPTPQVEKVPKQARKT